MIYQFAIAIVLFTTSFSLNSMEQQQPKKKSVKRQLGKALSHNHFSKSSKNKDTAETKKPIVPCSTLFKKLPHLASACTQYQIPKELKQYIQQMFFTIETNKLTQSGKFFENWKKFNLKLLDFHYLDQNNVEAMKDLLTSNPHRLTSQSYKTFKKTMPLSIKITLAKQFTQGIPVENEDAKYADAHMELLIGGFQYNRPFGIVYKEIFSPQEKKNMLPSSPAKRRKLIDTKKRQ